MVLPEQLDKILERFFACVHLGLRGCQEHYTMNVEDFTLNKTTTATSL